MKYSLKMKNTPVIAWLLLTLCILLPLSCSMAPQRKAAVPVHFVLLGNTYPESAFSWEDYRLKSVLKEVRGENPVFLVHGGNMIYGGMDWMGIRESDIHRQFRAFFQVMGSVDTIVYPMAGPKDLHNSSMKLFVRYSGRTGNYTFTYGPHLFVVLNRVPGPLSAEERKWLLDELDAGEKSSGIVVLSHGALFQAGPSRTERGCGAPVS